MTKKRNEKCRIQHDFGQKIEDIIINLGLLIVLVPTFQNFIPFKFSIFKLGNSFTLRDGMIFCIHFLSPSKFGIVQAKMFRKKCLE